MNIKTQRTWKYFNRAAWKIDNDITPRARDFPNPHDGEMKSDPSEKLYETPTKKTMILIK